MGDVIGQQIPWAGRNRRRPPLFERMNEMIILGDKRDRYIIPKFFAHSDVLNQKDGRVLLIIENVRGLDEC